MQVPNGKCRITIKLNNSMAIIWLTMYKREEGNIVFNAYCRTESIKIDILWRALLTLNIMWNTILSISFVHRKKKKKILPFYVTSPRFSKSKIYVFFLYLS
jgi:hypothetical protein